MHLVKLARMLANVHMMLMLMTFLAKPMFKVNKPLFISKQTMDVTWQKIPSLIKIYSCHKIFYDVVEYSTMSLNNIHMEKYILKIFHDVTWNMFEDSFLVHPRKFACSCSAAHSLVLLFLMWLVLRYPKDKFPPVSH
jgi:hypothetical protein